MIIKTWYKNHGSVTVYWFLGGRDFINNVLPTSWPLCSVKPGRLQYITKVWCKVKGSSTWVKQSSNCRYNVQTSSNQFQGCGLNIYKARRLTEGPSRCELKCPLHCLNRPQQLTFKQGQRAYFFMFVFFINSIQVIDSIVKTTTTTVKPNNILGRQRL